MTWAASVARTHPTELHSTLRDRYGVSWTWVGTTALPWPEAIHLVHAAAEDPSTALGAAIAGWDYPAEVTDLMLILAVGGKAAEAFMPYAHKHTAKAQAAPAQPALADEVAAAEADMAAMITIAPS